MLKRLVGIEWRCMIYTTHHLYLVDYTGHWLYSFKRTIFLPKNLTLKSCSFFKTLIKRELLNLLSYRLNLTKMKVLVVPLSSNAYMSVAWIIRKHVTRDLWHVHYNGRLDSFSNESKKDDSNSTRLDSTRESARVDSTRSEPYLYILFYLLFYLIIHRQAKNDKISINNHWFEC
jgi:hypothetical protein